MLGITFSDSSSIKPTPDTSSQAPALKNAARFSCTVVPPPKVSSTIVFSGPNSIVITSPGVRTAQIDVCECARGTIKPHAVITALCARHCEEQTSKPHEKE